MITSAVHTEVSTAALVSEIKNYKITSRTADTYVRMRNGETLIIGGLINEEEQKNIQKIPFLSNIPILGELFKNRTTSKTKTEVMMILTPHITEAGVSPAIYDTQSLENEFKDFDDNRFLKDIKKSERNQAEAKIRAQQKELDKEMRSIINENPSLSVTQAAVLTALDKADTCKKSTASSDNLRAQIKDYLEDSARARMEVDVARREIERLNREISSLRERIAENK